MSTEPLVISSDEGTCIQFYPEAFSSKPKENIEAINVSMVLTSCITMSITCANM